MGHAAVRGKITKIYQKDSCQLPNNSISSVTMEVCLTNNNHIGTECIIIPELQNNYPQLAAIKPLHFIYEDVYVILTQVYYHAVRPIEFLLKKALTHHVPPAYR